MESRKYGTDEPICRAGIDADIVDVRTQVGGQGSVGQTGKVAPTCMWERV